jgi:SAM-dependent methyltransferase
MSENQQRTAWNGVASGWKKFRNEAMGHLLPVGQAMIRSVMLRSGDTVLDIATGTGEPGLTAAGHVGAGKVVGIDLSEEMVAIAQENAVQKNLSNYSAEVGDAEKINFSEHSFDVILCRMGVMFFPKPNIALKEMFRVLKPSGRLALSFWNSPELNPWLTLIVSVLRRELKVAAPDPDAPNPFRFASPNKLVDLVREGGFQNISLQVIEGEMPFRSAEDYWEISAGLSSTVNAHFPSLNSEQKESIRAKVIAEVKPYFSQGPGKLPSSAWVLNATV